MSRGKEVGRGRRQIRDLNAEHRDESYWTKSPIPRFQEKPLSFRSRKTVPETDTGGQDENSKALERTLEKELGKLAP